MRSTILILLAALLTLAGYVPLEAKDEPKEEADPYHLFRVAGRRWLLKRTPKPGAFGNNTINYQQFEVKNCYETKADLGQTGLDAGKQPTDAGEQVMFVEFKPENFWFKDPADFKKGKTEQVKTEAGTFECTVWNAVGSADESRIWRSNDFPGLVVKQDDIYSTRVVIEFDWVEGDPGYKPIKNKKKTDDPEEIEPKRLYSTKGAQWVHRTDTTRGERSSKSIEVVQTEVKKVTDTECEIEITKLTQLLEKLKGEDPETRFIKFDDKFGTHLQPTEGAKLDRTEKRITKVGLFECTVYTFKDEEGRKGTAWYAKNWPGLMLKREVTGENYRAVTELIKFEE